MTMITPSYLGETIEYSSLHACRSTLEDPTTRSTAVVDWSSSINCRIALRSFGIVHQLRFHYSDFVSLGGG